MMYHAAPSICNVPRSSYFLKLHRCCHFCFVVDIKSEFLAFSFYFSHLRSKVLLSLTQWHSTFGTFLTCHHSQAPPHKNLPLDLMMTYLSSVTVRSDYDLFVFTFFVPISCLVVITWFIRFEIFFFFWRW